MNTLREDHEFITKHLPLVKPVVLGMRSRVPAAIETADLVQIGYVGLILASRTWDAALGPAQPWVRLMVRREILNYLAAQFVWEKARLQITPAHEPAALPAPVETEQQETLRVAIDEAKNGLTVRQRELVDLVYEHSMSLRSIGRGRALGIGLRAVLREHEAALGHLREQLRAAGFDYMGDAQQAEAAFEEAAGR